MRKLTVRFLPMLLMFALSVTGSEIDPGSGDVKVSVGETIYFDLASIVPHKPTTALRVLQSPTSLHYVVKATLTRAQDGSISLSVLNGYEPSIALSARWCRSDSVVDCGAITELNAVAGRDTIWPVAQDTHTVVLSKFTILGTITRKETP